MSKRKDNNRASPEERQTLPEDDLPGNWLTNPAYWDLCDKHETTFPMGTACPKCKTVGKGAPQS